MQSGGFTPKGKGFIKMWKDDISFIRQAKYLVENGYSVLMYDMRNHGESDLGTCPWVSWGPEEAKDVIAAVDFVSSHDDFKHANIGLLSICMGASATTYAYGMDGGLHTNPGIKALVVVQPLHYKEFVKAFGMPGFLRNAGRRKSQERLGFDMNEKTFISDVGSITVPTLVMQNKNDPWTDIDFVNAYYDGLQVEKEMLWLDLAKSRAAAYDNLGESPEPLATFFSKHL